MEYGNDQHTESNLIIAWREKFMCINKIIMYTFKVPTKYQNQSRFVRAGYLNYEVIADLYGPKY